MSLSKSFIVTTILLAAQVSLAGVLALTPSNRKDIADVSISAAATAAVQGRQAALQLAGAGLRKKWGFSVYVAQLFVSHESRFVRTDDGAAASIDGMATVAMQLNFVRGIGKDKITEAFEEALKANGTARAGAFDDLLNQFVAVKDGSVITLVGEKLADGSEVVTIETPAGSKTITGPKGFVKAVFSMWLGKTTDGGVQSLKASILKG